MSINGIPPHLGTLRGLQDVSRPRVDQERPDRVTPPTPPPAAVPARAPLAAGKPEPTLPVDPPPGTDPELWSVLSAEERVFFAKLGAMGPLTYGRISNQMRAETAIPRGGRLDVRG
jgi:hypothetical protein